jgi:hypothetical protein
LEIASEFSVDSKQMTVDGVFGVKDGREYINGGKPILLSAFDILGPQYPL